MNIGADLSQQGNCLGLEAMLGGTGSSRGDAGGGKGDAGGDWGLLEGGCCGCQATGSSESEAEQGAVVSLKWVGYYKWLVE